MKIHNEFEMYFFIFKGMLNAGVEGARGNQALKDITIALKWIQANINFFGGDPNTVTVFGESTGGGTASLLTLSPMTQGLYHYYTIKNPFKLQH